MKRNSFILISIIGWMTITSVSCKKQDQHMTNAVITGWDMTMCACCGGLMINFDGETRPYKGDFKLVENVDDLGISLQENFPLHVKVAWARVPDKCNDHFVRIEKLVRQ